MLFENINKEDILKLTEFGYFGYCEIITSIRKRKFLNYELKEVYSLLKEDILKEDMKFDNVDEKLKKLKDIIVF